MPKLTSSPSEKVFIDDVITPENSSLELEQQMVWVQIRKTIPSIWFMFGIAIWAAACFGYVWETSIAQSFEIDANGLWLLVVLLLPTMHYIMMGVLPFKALKYGQGLNPPLERVTLSWRYFTWIALALLFYAGLWIVLWFFELTLAFRFGGYFLLALIIAPFLLAYRHYYQKTLRVDY